MHIVMIDHFPESMRKRMADLPARLSYLPDADRNAVVDILPDTDVLVMNSKVRVDAELLSHAPRLRMLCRAGVGLDHFDLPLLEKMGVQVVSTPGANADTVAEQTIGTLLALMHRIAAADRQVRRFEWRREENRGTEVMAKNVGIIGYGNCGSRVARRLNDFGCRILAYDKYKHGFAAGFTEECGLETLMREADILSLHVPLTAETRNWINDDFFAALHKPVWLLNLARGPIVDLAALLRALDSGAVRGAGLDVLPNEKLDRLSSEEKALYEDLFSRDNVIVTPHIGGWSHESLERINSRIVNAVAEFLRENS